MTEQEWDERYNRHLSAMANDGEYESSPDEPTPMTPIDIERDRQSWEAVRAFIASIEPEAF